MARSCSFPFGNKNVFLWFVRGPRSLLSIDVGVASLCAFQMVLLWRWISCRSWHSRVMFVRELTLYACRIYSVTHPHRVVLDLLAMISSHGRYCTTRPLSLYALEGSSSMQFVKLLVNYCQAVRCGYERSDMWLQNFDRSLLNEERRCRMWYFATFCWHSRRKRIDTNVECK